MTVCQQCGEANPERFRLCGMCGAPLTVQQATREVRKTVTIVFSDVKGSTSLGERVDTESLRAALGAYFDAMSEILRRHGGTVEKYIGDAIMAVFGLPTVHEDDALRAVRAAYEMQAELASVNEALQDRWGIRIDNRTGVNTGEVVAGDPATGQRLVTGDAVNTAARLEQVAPVGQVLIGSTTYELVRDAVNVEPMAPLELKGKAEPVPAFRLVSVTSGTAVPKRLEAPMVGRRDELERLLEAQRATTETGTARMVTIIGSPGVGKSRLIQEFLGAVEPTTVKLRGRCLSYGDGITFWPLAEALRSAAAVEDEVPDDLARQRLLTLVGGRTDVAERLAPLLGLSQVTHPLEEIFWAARSAFESLATPAAVVVFDDIHWAEPTLLELIEHVVERSQAPILVLCSARGELLADRPAWGEQPGATRIELGPLSDTETEAVVANIVGGTRGLPDVIVSRIRAAAEGNPLYVEQVLSMLVDREVLRRARDGAWTVAGDVTEIAVPPTISALIAARLERLGVDDRSVLQAASVIGLVFYERAVESMSAEELRRTVGPSVARLVRRQFVRSEAATFMDEPSYRFDHALIHDEAYRSLLKRDRADLHERFAAWLEAIAGARAREVEEIVGYHLEQSARYLAELGPLDDRGRTLAVRAAEHLAGAGRRAFARGDMPAAANLLDRALVVRPDGGATRIELQLDLAETLGDLGEFARSETVAADGLDAARAQGDDLLAINASLVQLYLHYTVDPQGRSEQVIRDVGAAIPILEAAGDNAGLVRAWRLLGWVHGTACRYGAAEHAVSRAVHHARLAGDRRAETRNLMSLALSALYGPMPVPDAIETARATATGVTDDKRAEGVVLCALAHLYGLNGDFDAARTAYGKARTTLEELGGKVMAATVSVDSGPVELLAGRPEQAEAELRHDYDVLTGIGERYTLSTVAALLGEAVLRQGRLEEAIDLTTESAHAAAEDDVESQNLWRRVRAKALRDRDPPMALQLVEEAFSLLDGTDAPLLRGATLADMALLHASQGRLDEAEARAQQALEVFEAKGDVADAGATRTYLNGLRSRR